MTIPDFLTREPSGEIRFTGHRIDLYHLVHYYNAGYSAEMLACQFPTLPLALVHKTIAFYLDNKGDVDIYVGAYEDELGKQRFANPRRLDVEALRRRLEANSRANGA